MSRLAGPLLVLLLTGCSTLGGGSQIPIPPGSRPLADQQFSGKKETAQAITYVTTYKSTSSFKDAVKFYQDAFKEKPGWKQDGNGDEVASFSNGNIVLENVNDGRP